MSQSNNIAADDPRLTAYALGAMEPDEATAFEALLENDADARAEVEAIRALAGDLEAEFEDLPADEGLDATRREAVLAAPTTPRVPDRPRGRHLVLWGATVAAACLLFGMPLLDLFGFGFGGGGKGASDADTEHARSGAEPDLGALYSVTNSGYGPEQTASKTPFLENAPTADPSAIQAGSGSGARLLAMEQARTGGSEGHGSLPGPSLAPPMDGASSWGASSGPASPAPVTRPGGAVLPGLRGGSGVPPLGPSPNPTTPSSPTVGYIAPRAEGAKLGGAPQPVASTTLGVTVTENLDPVALRETGALLRLDATWRGFARGGTWANWNAQIHGEQYTHPGIDGFMQVTKRGGHTSTFSVDVDSASYSNVRRILQSGQRPHPAAVRIEEFVNYFDYGYVPPAADAKQPFAQHIQVATCPWNVKHRLVRIALKGKEVQREKRPASNLVFLVDVSGSMRDEDKLPLLQSGLEMLAENLDARDRVSIVTYSNNATLALESTRGDQRDQILAKIRSLKAGGGTNGAGGIQLAYAEAQKHFDKEGINRVILCTDGDFNVGVSDGPGLTRLVQEKAKNGVYLSVLGFGTGNLQDSKMEAYSNAGNGNYAYIDSLEEAKRVLVEEMEGTLITIAKDVKFQVWFNPKQVHAWRLLGYENRRLAAKDFNDDTKDAGDIGAGHEVTALYELVPTGVSIPGKVDPNPFVDGTPNAPEHEAPKKAADEPQPRENALFIWRLRWKQPDGDTSELVERNVFDAGLTFEQADPDFQWAASVTGFGMLLRHSPHRGTASYGLIEELAEGAKGEDPKGRRAEFLGLVKKASGR